MLSLTTPPAMANSNECANGFALLSDTQFEDYPSLVEATRRQMEFYGITNYKIVGPEDMRALENSYEVNCHTYACLNSNFKHRSGLAWQNDPSTTLANLGRRIDTYQTSASYPPSFFIQAKPGDYFLFLGEFWPAHSGILVSIGANEETTIVRSKLGINQTVDMSLADLRKIYSWTKSEIWRPK